MAGLPSYGAYFGGISLREAASKHLIFTGIFLLATTLRRGRAMLRAMVIVTVLAAATASLAAYHATHRPHQPTTAPTTWTGLQQ